MMLTFAFCTFNRARRLDGLVRAMRAQDCPIVFEILAVNNNSSDDTPAVLERLAAEPGAPLRVVTETRQGIVPARNRAIEEALGSDILVFIDDDELPLPGLLRAAHHAIAVEGAQCAGGRITIDLGANRRPAWLDDEIAGFLGELNHGEEPFWIEDGSKAVWCGNIAYDMQLFRKDPLLRFDLRYNRAGEGVGGGEDAMMFRALLAQGVRIRYRPDMGVRHAVDDWKLTRRYFLKLHYLAGVRQGRYRLPNYARTLFNLPPFLVSQFIRQTARSVGMQLALKPGSLRQGMNAINTLGCIVGYLQRPRL